jgi:DNA-binding transcriptional regulator YhcF (GntR family)
MLSTGQYVRAVLAEGLAASIPATEGFEPELVREGIVVQVRGNGTFVLEDYHEREHVCFIAGAVSVPLTELDPFIHNSVCRRRAELGLPS